MLGGALLLLSRHVRNINALVDWAETPLGTPVPESGGIWDLVFSHINRRALRMRDQRQQLSSELDRFIRAGQAMPDGVVYLGRANVIDWANHRAEAHFGLDAKRDAGAPMTNLVRNPEFVAYVANGNYSEPLLMRPLRRPELTLQVQIVPYADDKMMLLSRDVSQIERLENMRRDFVANVSHELRTPLTVVLGFLETLADGLGELSPAEQARYVKLAHEQADRMHQLIKDLLVLSALETGAPAAAEERFDVTELLEKIQREAQGLSAGRHEIRLEIESPDVLVASVKELHSAFGNLVSNAVRYSGAGRPILMRWRHHAGGGEFSVEDQGIGIAAVHLPRLTERFYRVDRGRSRESGGTGLGLAIVKHVLTRHQGRLEIESTLGKGSVFRAWLPARRVISRAPDAAA